MKKFDIQTTDGTCHRVQASTMETCDDYVQFLDSHRYVVLVLGLPYRTKPNTVVFVVPKHALIYAKLIGDVK